MLRQNIVKNRSLRFGDQPPIRGKPRTKASRSTPYTQRHPAQRPQTPCMPWRRRFRTRHQPLSSFPPLWCTTITCGFVFVSEIGKQHPDGKHNPSPKNKNPLWRRGFFFQKLHQSAEHTERKQRKSVHITESQIPVSSQAAQAELARHLGKTIDPKDM